MGYIKYSSVSAPLLCCHGDGEMCSLGSAKETAKEGTKFILSGSFFLVKPKTELSVIGQCSVMSGCFKQPFASLVQCLYFKVFCFFFQCSRMLLYADFSFQLKTQSRIYSTANWLECQLQIRCTSGFTIDFLSFDTGSEFRLSNLRL